MTPAIDGVTCLNRITQMSLVRAVRDKVLDMPLGY